MKKSDWLLTIGTFLYSYLFYKQITGINFLVFSVFLVLSLFLLNKKLLKDKYFLYYSGLYIVTGFFVMWNNSALSIWANLCSMLLVSAAAIKSESSVIMNGFKSIYSIGGSFVFMIINWIKSSQNKEQNPKKKNNFGAGLLITLVVILIGVVFFIIYKNANPLFEKYTNMINLDFISIGWIMFTLLGFFIMYGLLRHQRINALDEAESQLPITLVNKGAQVKSFEKTAGIALFILLNLMLLLINGLDVVYLYILKQLPEGITHTQFVHNGVGMLIFSIILGISIILFLFRNALNFDHSNKLIKILVGLWLLQNAMMVFSTGVRNFIYVSEFNLTYKRIGVFVYLTLSLIGLFLTLVKIYRKKSNWYLVKTNAFAWYSFLCFSALINWDKIICSFNIEKKQNKIQQLDKKYLLSLSDESIPYLQSLKEINGFEIDSAKKDALETYGFSDLASGRSAYYETENTNSSETDKKTYHFLRRTSQTTGWQSWNHRNTNIHEQLLTMNANEGIKSIHLNYEELDSLNILAQFYNIREMNLYHCSGNNFNFMNTYKKIENLAICGCGVRSLDELPELITIKKLNLSDNELSTLKGINKFGNLEEIIFSGNTFTKLNSLSGNKKLTTIDASRSSVTNLSGLDNLPDLTSLSLRECGGLEFFPELSNLKALDMSIQHNYSNYNLNALPFLPGLNSLNIAENSNLELHNLFIRDLRNAEVYIKFPNLKYLNASNSNLKNVEAISKFTQLEKLYLCNNDIGNTIFIDNLKHLTDLDLSYNKLSYIGFNDNQSGLKRLSLKGNAGIEDFGALSALTSLQFLDLNSTHFRDLSALNCETTLKELDIRKTRASDLTSLKKFTSLKILHLSNLSDKDKKILAKITALKTVFLDSTQFSPEYRNELQKQFPKLKIILQ